LLGAFLPLVLGIEHGGELVGEAEDVAPAEAGQGYGGEEEENMTSIDLLHLIRILNRRVQEGALPYRHI